MNTFEDKVAACRDNLLTLAYKFYPSSKDNREDLVEDTLLKMLLNKDKFEIDSNLRGWGYFIMKNIFINDYRAFTRRDEVYSLDSPEVFIQPSDLENDPFKYIDLCNLLSDLKYDYVKCLLCYARGYKYNEIAERFNLPLGTVKSRIGHARRYLEKIQLNEIKLY